MTRLLIEIYVKTLICVAAVVALASGAVAAGLPVSEMDATQAGFSTLAEAATAALEVAIGSSRGTELAGAVYRQRDQFFYTLPTGQNDDLKVDYRIRLPNGALLVALYHTHSGAAADEFSRSDIQTAREMKLVMCVGVVSARTVLIFDPARDHPVISPFGTTTRYRGGMQLLIP